jgi:hypothetical protein
MTLKTRINVSVSALHTSPLDLNTPSSPLDYAVNTVLASGVGADQADRIFHDQRTLAASTSENLDLAGVLVDAFGAVLTFARVKGIIVAPAAGNTNAVEVGGVANGLAGWVGDATSDKVVVRKGGLFLLLAPDAVAYPVTAGTADLIKIANSGAGTPVTYDVVIIGASA